VRPSIGVTSRQIDHKESRSRVHVEIKPTIRVRTTLANPGAPNELHRNGLFEKRSGKARICICRLRKSLAARTKLLIRIS